MGFIVVNIFTNLHVAGAVLDHVVIIPVPIEFCTKTTSDRVSKSVIRRLLG